MTIWRYENSQGEGPYMARHLNNEAQRVQDRLHGEHRYRPETHPGAGLDFECRDGWDRSDHIFGCPSREALNTWFLGFHTDLKAVGFQIRTYQVPARFVARGKSGLQVAFMKNWEVGGRQLPCGDAPLPQPVAAGPESSGIQKLRGGPMEWDPQPQLNFEVVMPDR